MRNISEYPADYKLTYNKLMDIHAVTRFKYGSLLDEFPEQFMTIQYLTGNEKVLEIGGNFGRNSMIIAYLLNNSTNYVVMESDLSEKTKKNVPTNPSLWKKSLAWAKSRYKVCPSAYCNGAAAKHYKSKGGKWKRK